MTILTIKIRSAAWTIHINEDRKKRGCIFIAKEIWANGGWQEVGADLTNGLSKAIDIEYGADNPAKPNLCPIIHQIMGIVGLRI